MRRESQAGDGGEDRVHAAVTRYALRQVAEQGEIHTLLPHLDPQVERVWGIRADVVQALGKTGDPRWVEHLVRAAGDPHPGVRLRAVEALVALGGGTEALKRVRAALEVTPKESLWERMIAACGRKIEGWQPGVDWIHRKELGHQIRQLLLPQVAVVRARSDGPAFEVEPRRHPATLVGECERGGCRLRLYWDESRRCITGEFYSDDPKLRWAELHVEALLQIEPGLEPRGRHGVRIIHHPELTVDPADQGAGEGGEPEQDARQQVEQEAEVIRPVTVQERWCLTPREDGAGCEIDPWITMDLHAPAPRPQLLALTFEVEAPHGR